MPQNVPSFDELMEATRTSAVHLEMRDQYAVGDEAEDYDAGCVPADGTRTPTRSTGRPGST